MNNIYILAAIFFLSSCKKNISQFKISGEPVRNETAVILLGKKIGKVYKSYGNDKFKESMFEVKWDFGYKFHYPMNFIYFESNNEVVDSYIELVPFRLKNATYFKEMNERCYIGPKIESLNASDIFLWKITPKSLTVADLLQNPSCYLYDDEFPSKFNKLYSFFISVKKHSI